METTTRPKSRPKKQTKPLTRKAFTEALILRVAKMHRFKTDVPTRQTFIDQAWTAVGLLSLLEPSDKPGTTEDRLLRLIRRWARGTGGCVHVIPTALQVACTLLGITYDREGRVNVTWQSVDAVEAALPEPANNQA